MRTWLREEREKAQFTQKFMAEKLGITENYYILIEHGDRQKKMDITLATKLADIFSIPISRIVELENS